MTDTLVLCDHAELPGHLGDAESVLRINTAVPHQNLRLEVWNLSHALLSTLDSIARDLLDIAAFVYHADGTVKRGTDTDVFNLRWVRSFTFVVPVRQPEVWEDEATTAVLVDALQYLTGDRYRFVFAKRDAVPEQLSFQPMREQLARYTGAECVTLFSGGADSLAGAVYLSNMGRKPVLVSHQPRPLLNKTQHALAAKLRERLEWEFPHLAICVNRKDSPAFEHTQRSRAFLYLALGSLVAHELHIPELVVCENGITSFNLPRLGQTAGTLATRSTHPHFMQLFRDLVSRVLGTDVSIEMPFLWNTRAEVLDVLKRSGCADLLPMSVSCVHTRREKYQPFCGVCSQCIDRRFAVTHEGLDTPEELGLYGKDIFTGELGEGPETALAAGTVMFALDVLKHSPQTFCEHYPEVYDAVGSVPLEPDEVLASVYDLHRRFSHEVTEVMGSQYRANLPAVFNCELPGTCLLMAHRSTSSVVPGEITRRARELAERLHACPCSEGTPYEEVCEEILTFLFCEHTPEARALRRPSYQSRTDHGRRRRDLMFPNMATEGFWAEVRHDHQAVAIVVDAKNYPDEIDSDTVVDFAAKYLDGTGPGRFGILVARKVPVEARTIMVSARPLPGAIDEQKRRWVHDGQVVILVDDTDMAEMLVQKASGADPTSLIQERFMTLRLRT